MEFLVFYINCKRLSATNKRSPGQILQCSWQPQCIWVLNTLPVPLGPIQPTVWCLPKTGVMSTSIYEWFKIQNCSLEAVSKEIKLNSRRDEPVTRSMKDTGERTLSIQRTGSMRTRFKDTAIPQAATWARGKFFEFFFFFFNQVVLYQKEFL